MRIPSKAECVRILKKHKVPQNIIGHSLAVSGMSLEVADAVASRGVPVDRELVLAGAILHDIAKAGEGDHLREGAVILRELGFHRVADVVERHGIGSLTDDNKPQSIEDKIVHYADKRVVEDKIVSIEERFDYLAEKYPTRFTPRGEVYQYIKELEKELLGSGILPSRQRCINILTEYDVPPKTIDHSIKVCERSLEIASTLESRGRKVNRNLLVAGALLHDIGKYCQGGPHEGAELLRKIGLPQVADIAERHAISDLSDENDKKPRSLEDKIVHYADKCIIGDADASVEARFDDLAERHPARFTARGRAYQYIKELERELLG